MIFLPYEKLLSGLNFLTQETNWNWYRACKGECIQTKLLGIMHSEHQTVPQTKVKPCGFNGYFYHHMLSVGQVHSFLSYTILQKS